MRLSLLLVFLFSSAIANASAPITGTWQMISLGVGPQQSDTSWWYQDRYTEGDVSGCLWDDTYSFREDGSYQLEQGVSTWLRFWQTGDGDYCGEPVAPHDGSVDSIYFYDQTNSELIIYGRGTYLGWAEAINNGELGRGAEIPDSIVYQASLDSDCNLVAFVAVDLELYADSPYWWTMTFSKVGDINELDLDGDGVLNSHDDFPCNSAASLDTDGDGAPDSWNPGVSETEILHCGLVLDAFPYDPTEIGDEDSDGVGDNTDACSATVLNNPVNGNGCSDLQLCDCDNATTVGAKGAYVSCVVKATNKMVRSNLITLPQAQLLRTDAAQSACGVE